MARDDDAQGILRDCTRDRPDRARLPDATREFPVRQRGSVGNGLERLPHPLLERRSSKIKRNAERLTMTGEILFQLSRTKLQISRIHATDASLRWKRLSLVRTVCGHQSLIFRMAAGMTPSVALPVMVPRLRFSFSSGSVRVSLMMDTVKLLLDSPGPNVSVPDAGM